MLFGQITLALAAAFTGAAVYILLAEHPSRLTLSDSALLEQWKRSYARGFAMQGTLALVGGGLGIVTAFVTNDARWALGAILLLVNWPYTIAAMMRLNKRLMAMKTESPPPELRTSLAQWAWLHSVRCILGLLATIACIWALN